MPAGNVPRKTQRDPARRTAMTVGTACGTVAGEVPDEDGVETGAAESFVRSSTAPVEGWKTRATSHRTGR